MPAEYMVSSLVLQLLSFACLRTDLHSFLFSAFPASVPQCPQILFYFVAKSCSVPASLAGSNQGAPYRPFFSGSTFDRTMFGWARNCNVFTVSRFPSHHCICAGVFSFQATWVPRDLNSIIPSKMYGPTIRFSDVVSCALLVTFYKFSISCINVNQCNISLPPLPIHWICKVLCFLKRFF